MKQIVSTWLDERVGTKTLNNTLLKRKIPILPGWMSWLNTMGSVCLVLFFMQVLTGMFMAMNYSPSTDHAYDSVQYIMSLPSGPFIRGLHFWGASALVLTAVLHVLWKFIIGAYKFPREATWITGVCLFLIVMGYFFTGYLLPWDQRAYWATTVGIRMSEQVPYIGVYIGSVLKGGTDIGVRTLTRFYTFHGFIFTTLFLVMGVLHLYLVVRNGISGLLERMNKLSEYLSMNKMKTATENNQHSWKQAVHNRYHEFKLMGESFFPYVIYKDAIVMAIVITVLSFLSIFFPPVLESVADPTDKNSNPRPDWPFLFFFQLLKYIPPQFETIAIILIPTALLAILFGVPFLDRYAHRHPADRPYIVGFGLVLVTVIVFLGVQGYRAPFTNPIVEKNRQEIMGQRIYFEKVRCQICHSINGKGGIAGPALDTVGSRRNKKWLTDHFRNPQKVSPNTTMPNFGLLDEEIQALVVYMSSLGGGSFSPKAPELFKENCAACHKIGNEGEDLVSDLSDIGRYKQLGELTNYINNPKAVDPKAEMDGFGDSLSKTEIEDLARYLSAQRGQAK